MWFMLNRIWTRMKPHLQDQEDQEDSEHQIQMLQETFGCSEKRRRKLKKREERRRCHGQTFTFCVSDNSLAKMGFVMTVLVKE
jgi:hypothetical protein